MINLFFATTVVAINLVIDLVYGYLDPRSRAHVAGPDANRESIDQGARPSVNDTAAAPIIRNTGKAIDAARGPQVQCGAWTSPTRSTTWCSST